ncbi:MAG: hypothetical protein PHF37_01605 [Phycisphaerae bacterium]|nr:hypothetical protein [Phycisphaerae bacterium]
MAYSHIKTIAAELKNHAPFTMFGAGLGLLFMFLFRNIGMTGSLAFFTFFHPAHVVLSAIVTAAMFRLHAKAKKFIFVLIIGYFGSIGVATISDIIIPYIGTELLGLNIPSHAEVFHDPAHHSEEVNHEEHAGKHEGHKLHLGFIEEWYIVNPAAIIGVLIAWFIPRTKFPHAGHILVSTWASSAYMLMEIRADITFFSVIGIFITLFLAVWLPCCVSDIIFPLLFIESKELHKINGH